VVRLETLGGKTLGMNYGDTLDFGTRTQKKKDILLFGEFAPNLLATSFGRTF
jgi:hypothetical protein